MAVSIGFLLLAFSSSLFAQGTPEIMGLIRGDSLGSQFGKKVVPAGDVNGDTIPDFLVLATGDQKAYLFHGKKDSLDTLPDLVFEQRDRLELLGDLNGDGGLDFSMRPGGQFNRLSVYFGGACLDTVTDGSVVRDSFVGPFWINVSGGKLSDTGSSQIVVGYTLVGFDTTRFYFFNVAQGLVDSLPFKTLDLENRQGFPAGPAQTLGDINGDGYADLAIGRQASTQNGVVEIYLGNTTFDTLPDIILNPPSYLTPGLAAAFGSKLASVEDLNNDGLADFVVGASRTPLLYFGGNPLDTLPLFVLDRIGDHFVNGGDINADGYTDLLVGRNESITGYAYVYYGGSSTDSVRDLEVREVDLPFRRAGLARPSPV